MHSLLRMWFGQCRWLPTAYNRHHNQDTEQLRPLKCPYASVQLVPSPNSSCSSSRMLKVTLVAFIRRGLFELSISLWVSFGQLCLKAFVRVVQRDTFIGMKFLDGDSLLSPSGP